MRLRRKVEPYEFWALATFNAERARGILHAPGWCDLMDREQARFDAREPSRFAEERLLVPHNRRPA